MVAHVEHGKPPNWRAPALSMRNHGGVTDELRASWDYQAAFADWYDGLKPAWSPPSFKALVAAAQATTLRRLFPFTSHWVLRFRANEDMLTSLASIAPGSIAVTQSGLYAVQSGLKWHGSVDATLFTADPEEAAAALAQLLADWEPRDEPQDRDRE